MPKLNPGRRARLDQILAGARAQSINDNATVTVIAAVDGNPVCSWCDCPIIDHSGGRVPPGCAGCTRTAVNAVHQFNPGGDYRGNIPICEHHMTDFIDTYHSISSTTPEVVLYDPNPSAARERKGT